MRRALRSLGGQTTVLLSPNDIDGEIDPAEAAKGMARKSAFALRLDAEVDTEDVDIVLRARRTVDVGGLGDTVSGHVPRRAGAPQAHAGPPPSTVDPRSKRPRRVWRFARMTERFPGKHVAIVIDNDDPKKLSRVRVKVPEIFGDEETGWCLPCTPYAGDKVGWRRFRPRAASSTWSGRPGTPRGRRSGPAASGPTAPVSRAPARTLSSS